MDCEGVCGGDAVIDDCGECNGDNSNCNQGFNVTIDPTGVSHLIIFQDSIEGLDIGDQIGVFDLNGVSESCFPENGCDTDLIEYNEVLVGSGEWDGISNAEGTVISFAAIMSQDLSTFNGPILNGAVEGNQIEIRVYDVSEDTIFDTNPNFTSGGEFGDLFSVVSELNIDNGGEGEDQCDSQVCLSLDQGNLNYSSTEDIAGFQFNHDGCITSAFGGDAADNGFTISSSASAVLAFSFSGSVIPQGTLIELTGNISEDCLSGFIFSDYSGEELSVEFGEPLSDDGGVDTCEDSNACNFGQEGDCEYPEEFYDCNGNCIVDVDCEGVCGGNAVIDDCGECNGNNDCIDAGNLLY